MSAPLLLALRVGLALSLYAFLGWAFLMLWRSLQKQSELLAARKTPPISLTYPGMQSKPVTQHFNQPEITLGRDPHCEVALESETVSAYHARLTHHHGQWWLEDLNSTNGTTLNEERVSTPTVVISNDKISCGKVTLRVQLSKDSLSPPTEKI